MNVFYPAIFDYNQAENRYTVRFPDLTEAVTEGETDEEAHFNEIEVLTLTLEGRLKDIISCFLWIISEKFIGFL